MALLTRDDKDDTRILIKVSDLDLNHLGLKMVVVLLCVEVAKCSWSQRFKYKVHKTWHLTSKSDVYSFGVVLLELLTGRRSIDKNRPIGQQNLVAWARPFMIDRRWFFRLMDPQLEGRFSIKGAPRAIQLAAQCLNRDPKARPLMSEVVQILTPLPHLKDMASSSPHFQAMQAEGMGSNLTPRSGNTVQAGVLPRTARSTGASPISSSPHVSPYRLNRRDTVQTGASRTARSTGASPIPNSPHVSPYRLNRSPKPIAQSSRSPKPSAQSSRSPKPSAQQP